MGQTIEVKSVVIGEVALFDTDRSLTGQDGLGFGSAQQAGNDSTTAARLALRLFEGNSGVDHVHVLSNTVTVRRSGEWSDDVLTATVATIRDFFTFYEENRGGEPGVAGSGDE